MRLPPQQNTRPVSVTANAALSPSDTCSHTQRERHHPHSATQSWRRAPAPHDVPTAAPCCRPRCGGEMPRGETPPLPQRPRSRRCHTPPHRGFQLRRAATSARRRLDTQRYAAIRTGWLGHGSAVGIKVEALAPQPHHALHALAHRVRGQGRAVVLAEEHARVSGARGATVAAARTWPREEKRKTWPPMSSARASSFWVTPATAPAIHTRCEAIAPGEAAARCDHAAQPHTPARSSALAASRFFSSSSWCSNRHRCVCSHARCSRCCPTRRMNARPHSREPVGDSAPLACSACVPHCVPPPRSECAPASSPLQSAAAARASARRGSSARWSRPQSAGACGEA